MLCVDTVFVFRSHQDWSLLAAGVFAAKNAHTDGNDEHQQIEKALYTRYTHRQALETDTSHKQTHNHNGLLVFT